MSLAQLSPRFQSLALLPTSKLGPSGADSWVGGFVYILGQLWVSPVNSAVRGGVTPTATTPKVFTARDFEAFFSHAVTLGCTVCFTCQLFLQVYPHANVGLPGPPAATSPAQSSSRCLAMSPLCPGSRSPPLLPVWMNVSSLTPWLLDFHKV